MKVLTVSRKYPDYHYLKGEKTFFVEKILNCHGIDYGHRDYLEYLKNKNPKVDYAALLAFQTSLNKNLENGENISKYNTIRPGNKIKDGERLSLS